MILNEGTLQTNNHPFKKISHKISDFSIIKRLYFKCTF